MSVRDPMTQPADPVPMLRMPELSVQGRRRLGIATAVVFCISSAFPVVAGFVRDTESWPKWWGVLDVGIAFLLAMLAFAVVGAAGTKIDQHSERASYRAYRGLNHGLLAILVVFFLLGDRI